MNPSSRETSGISLPPPVAEQAPGQADGGSSQAAPEQQAATPETAQNPGAGQPSMSPVLPAVQQTAQPSPQPAAGQSDSNQSANSTSSTASVSDDSDKVEKEWVDKARKIVEQTKHDPHRQSEELTVMKADYMKQRYNKIVKVEK